MNTVIWNMNIVREENTHMDVKHNMIYIYLRNDWKYLTTTEVMIFQPPRRRRSEGQFLCLRLNIPYYCFTWIFEFD